MVDIGTIISLCFLSLHMVRTAFSLGGTWDDEVIFYFKTDMGTAEVAIDGTGEES